ncbi:MAG TPA: hypothetical protein PK629_01120 [Oscillospiraceae bacterium]|nr:hypothetical protein [Oscillospiraceae bacterium]HPF55410.1 hypothetical protein [Clostridiales bacterium]HPK35621.1 hypothetical protein [Oscillospiraceae bacterium]HPR74685.1 hypothetical protein [Oscillospiraceae bacterium]
MEILLNQYQYRPKEPDFVIDFNKIIGPIKPVNGTCNAPTERTAKYFKKVRPSYTRLHDSFIHHLACVDVPAIFPNFDADENDPKNYFFAPTDYYIKSIKDTGMDIVYRLGNSMEGGPFRFHNQPPKDFEKWARICCRIIEHYNHGWADGFTYDIRYWEIWNEPDADLGRSAMAMAGQWSGTPEQFYEFYCVASSVLKNRYPELKFGGYASCAVDEPSRRIFFEGFLTALQKAPHAFDFFSFHAYGDSFKKLRDRVHYITQSLENNGFSDIELLCTEYNYFWEFEDIWPKLGDPNGEYFRAALFEEMRSARAASYILGAMITFQNLPVQIANFYRTDGGGGWDTCFDPHGVPQKPYYALMAFHEVSGMNQIECTGGADGVLVLAAKSNAEKVILIANYEGVAREYKFETAGLPEKYEARFFVTDNNNDHAQTGVLGPLPEVLYLRPGSITVIKITE